MTIPDAAIEAAAEALDMHRWKNIGVSSVSCECGEVVHGDDSLNKFPADEAFRGHMARAAIEAAEPHVREHMAQEIVAEVYAGQPRNKFDRGLLHAARIVRGGTP